MSLTLPRGFHSSGAANAFHVETLSAPTCKNPQCRRTINAEFNFCPDCWSQINPGTRARLVQCQRVRNKPGFQSNLRRAKAELRKASRKGQRR